MERITHNGVQLWPKAKVADRRFTVKNRIKAALRLFMLRLSIATTLGTLLFGVYLYGMAEAANTQTVVNQIQPPQKEAMAVVMQRIAGCESEGKRSAEGKQFNANGTLVTHLNDNGSLDLGKYQINLTAAHLNQAMKMHLDLTTEEGNEAFAKWIYENEGTSPWKSSQHCWQ